MSLKIPSIFLISVFTISLLNGSPLGEKLPAAAPESSPFSNEEELLPFLAVDENSTTTPEYRVYVEKVEKPTVESNKVLGLPEPEVKNRIEIADPVGSAKLKTVIETRDEAVIGPKLVEAVEEEATVFPTKFEVADVGEGESQQIPLFPEEADAGDYEDMEDVKQNKEKLEKAGKEEAKKFNKEGENAKKGKEQKNAKNEEKFVDERRPESDKKIEKEKLEIEDEIANIKELENGKKKEEGKPKEEAKDEEEKITKIEEGKNAEKKEEKLENEQKIVKIEEQENNKNEAEKFVKIAENFIEGSGEEGEENDGFLENPTIGPEEKEQPKKFGGAIQELKLHDDPAEAANQCNENWWKTRRRDFSARQKGKGGEGNKKKPRPKDAEKAGLGSSGFGPPEEEIQGETEKTPTAPPSPAPPPPARPPMQRMTSTSTTTTETAPMLTTTVERKPPAQHIWEGAMAPPMPGPKGEKGERGEPGQCAAIECPMPPPGPPGLPGLPGAPGEFPGLTDSDLARISAWPGLKGAKGDKGECPPREAVPGDDQAEVVLLNGKHQKLTELPPYNARVHGNGRGQKGEKGERGSVGPMGPPGLPGPPAVHQQQQKFEPQQAMPAVAVYQTALELLAAAPRCPVGSLAFAISTQQLFLRVHAGWRQVMLDKSLLAQPAADYQYQQQPVAAPQHLPVQLDTSTDSELSRLAYWLALDEPANNGGNGNDEAIVQPPPAKSPILPEAQPWRARWPPKEIRPLMEEFEEEQRRKEAKEKNRVQSSQFRHKDRVIHLVALNEPLSGDFGGVRGADLECYRQARQAGFSTTFRAFLSSRVQDLNKLVHADDRHQTPVVNTRGERLFDSWDGVFDGGAHAHVPLYSFTKRDIFADWAWSERWLWHGSTREGLRSNAYCSEWRSSAADDVGMASPLHTRHSLTEQAREMPCDRRLAVLCIEVMSKFNIDLKIGKRFMADLRH